MRLASWRWGGTDHVGLISPDGREATPLACADASRGVQPLLEALAEGRPLPREAGTRAILSAVNRAERDAAANTLAAYRRDLALFGRWLAGRGWRWTPCANTICRAKRKR